MMAFRNWQPATSYSCRLFHHGRLLLLLVLATQVLTRIHRQYQKLLQPCDVYPATHQQAPSTITAAPPTTPATQPFPRWQTGGIQLKPVLQFVFTTFQATNVTIPLKRRAYIVDEHMNIWTKRYPLRLKQRRSWVNMVDGGRFRSSEDLMKNALQWAKHHPSGSEPLLRAIEKGGFPMLAFYADAAICNDNRDYWSRVFYDGFVSTSQTLSSDALLSTTENYNTPVPVFTLNSLAEGCNYTFPWPTYETIRTARVNDGKCPKQLDDWDSKYKKAVWRGSLTGRQNTDNQRWRLAKLAFENDYSVIDARLVYHSGDDFGVTADQLAAKAGGWHPKLPKEQFSLYRAILDVDGNGWSSRFGGLLCSSSVILKVEPRWVDFFHYKLEPWKHFIPVQGDLSDVLEKVEYAVADENRQVVQGIVRNANLFCSQHLTTAALYQDVVSILNRYVVELDRADPNWSEGWKQEKQLLLSSKGLVRIL